MSTTFYLALIPPSELVQLNSAQEMSSLGFEINNSQFSRSLKAMWPDVSLTLDMHSVEWELEDEDGLITGAVENPYMVTVTPGSTEKIVEFVNWYRHFVPEEYTLYLFHLGQSKGIVLEGQHLITDVDLEVF